jgi:hypothetical protein
MLAASATAAHSACLTHDFSQETLYVIGQRKKMTVTAMIAVDEITWTQSAADGDSGEFLSYASVDRSNKLSFSKQVQQLLLHRANGNRPLV